MAQASVVIREISVRIAQEILDIFATSYVHYPFDTPLPRNRLQPTRYEVISETYFFYSNVFTPGKRNFAKTPFSLKFLCNYYMKEKFGTKENII